MQEETGVLRGRINIPGSLHLIARRAPRLSCEFDELTHDVLHNRILKSTISRLLNADGLDRELAHELRLLLRVFDGVSDVRLSKLLFRNVQIHRNNAFYDFLLKVCELVCDLTLPDKGGNEYKFVDILCDEKKMAQVFEDFVRNFYRLEQEAYRVSPLQMRWDARPVGNQDLSVLPSMRTDIHLEGRTNKVNHRHQVLPRSSARTPREAFTEVREPLPVVLLRQKRRGDRECLFRCRRNAPLSGGWRPPGRQLRGPRAPAARCNN